MRIKEFFFTAFYSGYIPRAPGTAGSVVGLALFWGMYSIFGEWHSEAALAVVLVSAYPLVRLCSAAENYYGKTDPQCVVIDETAGMWITLLFVPLNWKTSLLGFVLFRLFDIVKPFPADRFQELKGGLGIMADDWVAGVYACIVLHLIYQAQFLAGITILI